jgi:hypothetical protein
MTDFSGLCPGAHSASRHPLCEERVAEMAESLSRRKPPHNPSCLWIARFYLTGPQGGAEVPNRGHCAY